jgi:hypothetical protein
MSDSQTTQSTDTPLAVVQELGRRFGAGDPTASRLFSPRIRIEQPASLPHGGVHEGLDGMGAMGRRFAEHWTRTIAGARVFGDADHPVQLTTQTWTGVATGRSATVDVLELFTVADGLITGIRVFQQDTALLLALL